MSKEERFLQSPKGTSKRRAVLDWNSGTYRPLEDVDGSQPWYTYQGIGNTVGIKVDHIVHNDIQVTHNGQDVIR